MKYFSAFKILGFSASRCQNPSRTSCTFCTSCTSQKGLTLIELLISGLVASFLLMGTLALITSFLKSRATISYSYNLQSVSESVFNHLASEIQQADSAQISGLSRLSLSQDEDQIHYFINSSDQLVREDSAGNTETITPETIKILTFNVYDLSSSDNSTSATPALININLELQNFTKGVPRDTLETQTTISVRPNKVKGSDQ